MDQCWRQTMNIQKMRHFKQIFAYLKLYNIIRFIDGKFVELLHDIGKSLQSKHSNHHSKHKEQISRQSFRFLTMLYIINGGKWGLNMSHCLGNCCINLRDPTDPNKINLILKNLKIPKQHAAQQKIQITILYNKDFLTVQEIENNGKTDEFMQLINNGLTYNNTLTWASVKRNKKIVIRKIQCLRFHEHHRSFAINFDKEQTCVVKTNTNHICQFSKAYVVRAVGSRDVIVGFGCFWLIIPSQQSSQWVSKNFKSMDSVNKNKRANGWFYLTNIEEPVFLFHECVSFQSVQSTLPNDWRAVMIQFSAM